MFVYKESVIIGHAHTPRIIHSGPCGVADAMVVRQGDHMRERRVELGIAFRCKHSVVDVYYLLRAYDTYTKHAYRFPLRTMPILLERNIITQSGLDR